jgi:hypothetical protein
MTWISECYKGYMKDNNCTGEWIVPEYSSLIKVPQLTRKKIN